MILHLIEAIQGIIEEMEDEIKNIFEDLQAEFDMKRKCIDLDKFEKIKRRWLGNDA